MEGFREFVHVIVELTKKYGFTHLVDVEMGFGIEQPKPIIQVINESLQNGGWTPEDQKRVLEGLDISRLES